MLEYVKKVLTKVSFDAQLFEKELKKSIKWLMPVEIGELRQWCYAKFGHVYEVLLNRCFVQLQH